MSYRILSQTLKIFSKWLDDALEHQMKFVDEVYLLCEHNYDKGGDIIVECYYPEDVLESFNDLQDVVNACKRLVAKELDARWGEDSDQEIARYERSKSKWKGISQIKQELEGIS